MKKNIRHVALPLSVSLLSPSLVSTAIRLAPQRRRPAARALPPRSWPRWLPPRRCWHIKLPTRRCCRQLACAGSTPLQLCCSPQLVLDFGRRRDRGGTGYQKVGGISWSAWWPGARSQWRQKEQTSSAPDLQPRPHRVRRLHRVSHMLPPV
jgi:hypothetical protein